MISIVIPVRNGAAFVAEAVSSALAQGDLVREVIVVDDASTDQTVAIVSAMADPRIRLITDRANHATGVSAVRNSGFALATQPWVMFLDADDRLQPNALQGLLDAERTPATVAIYADYDRIDASGARIGRRGHLRRRQKPQGAIVEPLMAGNFIVNGGVMLIRSDAFRAIGGFDETLRYCEDWHAWCKLAATGDFVYVAGRQVLDYRVHQSSAMMARPLTLDDYRPALDAVFGDPAIIGTRDHRRIHQLRRAAEAHLSAYLVAQALRSGRYWLGFTALMKTLLAYPSRAVRSLMVSGAALAGL